MHEAFGHVRRTKKLEAKCAGVKSGGIARHTHPGTVASIAPRPRLSRSRGSIEQRTKYKISVRYELIIDKSPLALVRYNI